MDDATRLEQRLRRFLSSSMTEPAPPGLAVSPDHAIVRHPRLRLRTFAIAGGSLALTAAVATVALLTHEMSRVPAIPPPVSSAVVTQPPTRSPVPTPSSSAAATASAILATPPFAASATLTFAGPVSGTMVIPPYAIDCGEPGGSGGTSILAWGSLHGHRYVVYAGRGGPGTGETGVTDMSAKFAWSAQAQSGQPPGLVAFDPDRGATLASVLPSAQFYPGTAPLHIHGTITCPTPGAPTSLAFSGNVVGQMVVGHVNCSQQSGYGPAINVIGTVGGRQFEVVTDVGTITGAPNTVSVAGPSLQAGYSGDSSWQSSPGTGFSHFNVTRGVTIDAVAHPYSGGAKAPLHVTGIVTCPD